MTDKEKPSAPVDALTLIRQLDAKAIRERLAELEDERTALRLLLRAALRMEKT